MSEDLIRRMNPHDVGDRRAQLMACDPSRSGAAVVGAQLEAYARSARRVGRARETRCWGDTYAEARIHTRCTARGNGNRVRSGARRGSRIESPNAPTSNAARHSFSPPLVAAASARDRRDHDGGRAQQRFAMRPRRRKLGVPPLPLMQARALKTQPKGKRRKDGQRDAQHGGCWRWRSRRRAHRAAAGNAAAGPGAGRDRGAIGGGRATADGCTLGVRRRARDRRPAGSRSRQPIATRSLSVDGSDRYSTVTPR